jgi:hypothetical protein
MTFDLNNRIVYSYHTKREVTGYRYEFRTGPLTYFANTNSWSVTKKTLKIEVYCNSELHPNYKTILWSSKFTASQNGTTSQANESWCLQMWCVLSLRGSKAGSMIDFLGNVDSFRLLFVLWWIFRHWALDTSIHLILSFICVSIPFSETGFTGYQQSLWGWKEYFSFKSEKAVNPLLIVFPCPNSDIFLTHICICSLCVQWRI